jgi:hypothetical protein
VSLIFGPHLISAISPGLLDELVVCFQNFELFPVDWISIFQVNFVFVVFGQPQIILVNANGLLVVEQDIDVSFSEFIWDLEMAPAGNFVPGNSWFLDLW